MYYMYTLLLKFLNIKAMKEYLQQNKRRKLFMKVECDLCVKSLMLNDFFGCCQRCSTILRKIF